ncbi:MAG TPA: energy transducer TonB [Candidatus Aquilonibacter sp.]|nr:energy transducer TonB [Candidatus Aquilonibacter sp.]
MSTHRMLVPDGAVLSGAGEVPVQMASRGAGFDPFLNALLEMPTTDVHDSRRPAKMAVSVLVHALLIAALLVIPVYFASNTLQLQKLAPTYVFTLPPVAAPPPPPAAARASQTTAHSPAAVMQQTFVAPRAIPKIVSSPAATISAPAPDLNAGDLGGVPGGVPGGVLGGLLGGTGTIGPPVPANTPGIVRVGGSVRPPELLQQIQPEYPEIARAAHVQGTVVIDAVIDTTGNVISERALSGPGLLVPAALSAVQQWKYQPTFLNGKPVKLAMEVTVSFHLSS